MRFSVIHPGTQYAIRVAEILSNHEMLSEFWTGIGFSKSSASFRLIETLVPWLSKTLENRVSGVLRHDQIKSIPIPELSLLINQYRYTLDTSRFLKRNQSFQQSIPRRVFQKSDAVVGYDTSSWIVAQRCNAFSKPFVLDQSIGHSKAKDRIFEKLRLRYSDWGFSIPHSTDEGRAYEQIEHELARVIVVPSRFVAETLVSEGVSESKIVTIPFGTNTSSFKPPSQARSVDCLRLLFVGAISVRKGVPDLIEAWRIAKLENAELWLAGFGEIPPAVKANLPQSVKFLGRLGRTQVAEHMRQANALFFPSYFEGLAQVQIEALACALPVIATHESGASDIVSSERTGLIIEAGNIEQMVTVLRRLDKNRELLSEWEANLLKNPQDWSWGLYGDRWVSEVPKRLS
jgi:starch synthase